MTLRKAFGALVLLIGLAGPLVAQNSFTLDFQDPQGTGVNFADAIPLATLGAIKDSMGQPIGFTSNGGSAPGVTLPGATLTPAGLTFAQAAPSQPRQPRQPRIPFRTDGAGTMSVVLRITSVSGMDTDFESVGFSIGSADDADNFDNRIHALTFHNSIVHQGQGVGPIIYQLGVRTDSQSWQHNYVTGEQAIQVMTLSASTAPGSELTGHFDGASIDATLGGVFDDLVHSKLGRDDTFVYLHAATDLAITFSSITFSGPNVAPPPTDSDGDNLTDEDETNVYLTDPNDPDSDDDGLLDGTEVDMQAMSEVPNCPDPLNADSDGDMLLDGQEVNSSPSSSPCKADTDGDGLSDGIDADPTVPWGGSWGLAQAAIALADQIEALDPSLFVAANENAAKGRRNAVVNRIRSAAVSLAYGNLSTAAVLLPLIHGAMEDWLVDSPEKTFYMQCVLDLIALL